MIFDGKTYTLNVMAFVWIGFATWLCLSGRLSWWVLVVLFASHTELKITFRR